MNLIGNIIWLIFGGIIASIVWFIAGLILCVSVIGLPFSVQCIRISKFVLWPFGKEKELGHFGAGGLLFNIIWLIFLWMGVCHCSSHNRCNLCITIVGIPFGIQHFKFALLGLMPFGAEIS